VSGKTPDGLSTAVEDVDATQAVGRDPGRLLEPADDVEIGFQARETEALDAR
jgi:hypothetical protein